MLSAGKVERISRSFRMLSAEKPGGQLRSWAVLAWVLLRPSPLLASLLAGAAGSALPGVLFLVRVDIAVLVSFQTNSRTQVY
jgi:hypothetical protein